MAAAEKYVVILHRYVEVREDARVVVEAESWDDLEARLSEVYAMSSNVVVEWTTDDSWAGDVIEEGSHLIYGDEVDPNEAVDISLIDEEEEDEEEGQ